MNIGEVQLSFNEPVDITKLEPTRITIQSSRTSSAISYDLTGAANTSDSSDRTIVTFRLTAADILGIKLIAGLAFERSTSFLSLTAGVIQDTGGNAAVNLVTTNAAQVGIVFVHVCGCVCACVRVCVCVGGGGGGCEVSGLRRLHTRMHVCVRAFAFHIYFERAVSHYS